MGIRKPLHLEFNMKKNAKSSIYPDPYSEKGKHLARIAAFNNEWLKRKLIRASYT